MKSNVRTLLFAALAFVAGAAVLVSCSKKQPSVLVPLVDKLNLDLASMAENSPMFLSEASAAIDSVSGVITVKASFSDSLIDVRTLSEALVQYYTAQQLKANPGKDLDTFLNGMTAEKGSLEVALADVYGNSRTYTMDATRLKQLFKLSPMQLNFNDVKSNVVEILASRCADYREGANAQDCSFEIQGGFATYTLTFAKASNYANFNQGSLKGRYLHRLQPVYEDMQAFRGPVEEMLRSLQIEGYRFVYVPAGGTGKELKVAIPWREI
jgi:hypothetical protein